MKEKMKRRVQIQYVSFRMSSCSTPPRPVWMTLSRFWISRVTSSVIYVHIILYAVSLLLCTEGDTTRRNRWRDTSSFYIYPHNKYASHILHFIYNIIYTSIYTERECPCIYCCELSTYIYCTSAHILQVQYRA